MNTNILLDVAELALSHLDGSSIVCYVNVTKLYEEHNQGRTLCKSTISQHDFKKALRIMFPIYKNNRKNTTEFKISTTAPYRVCNHLLIKLRPLEHILKGRRLCL